MRVLVLVLRRGDNVGLHFTIPISMNKVQAFAIGFGRECADLFTLQNWS